MTPVAVCPATDDDLAGSKLSAFSSAEPVRHGDSSGTIICE